MNKEKQDKAGKAVDCFCLTGLREKRAFGLNVYKLIKIVGHISHLCVVSAQLLCSFFYLCTFTNLQLQIRFDIKVISHNYQVHLILQAFSTVVRYSWKV